MKYNCTILILFIFLEVSAQPYIDLVHIRLLKSPDAGILRQDLQPNKFDYFQAGLNLPLMLKEDSSTFVFSPFFERWDISISNVSYLPTSFQGLALPLAYIRPVADKWTIAFSVIPRWNGHNGNLFRNSFQLGALALTTYTRKQNLKYKFGLYYNSEFSGPFFMPLAGIDWRPDAKNTIFGVLPGNIAWEHKATRRLFGGIVFRAVTNTYYAGRLNNEKYFLRINDNQLSLYADIYITKKLVVNAEAGHSVLRAFKLGNVKSSEKYFYRDKTNDNWIFRISCAYRMRL